MVLVIQYVHLFVLSTVPHTSNNYFSINYDKKRVDGERMKDGVMMDWEGGQNTSGDTCSLS